ncbi:unnamed protein product [Brassica napus]|uniref:(rape) hypothetical protein n=1 Tax=Brassica napus TaxID=3708 RepID=A0A816ISE5_BRANA|nr:unnamed protein product [Brassica napus]
MTDEGEGTTSSIYNENMNSILEYKLILHWLNRVCRHNP